MRSHAKVSILLSVLLLLGSLSGCESKPGIADIGSVEKEGSIVGNDPLYVPPPGSDNGVKFDASHKLEVTLPEVPDGELELPVQGATGYAPVYMPLWKNRPGSAQANRTAAGTADKADIQALLASIGAASAHRLSSPEEGGSDSGMTAPDTTAPPVSTEPVSPPPTDNTQPPAGGGDTTTPPAGGGDTAQPPAGGDTTTPPDGAGDEPANDRNQDLLDWLHRDDPDNAGGSTGGDRTPNTSTPQTPNTNTSRPPATPSGAVTTLAPGTAFTVLQEVGNYWFVRAGDQTGWVDHRYCFINLPDVIPSIVYNATNGYSSAFVSSGKDIPGITGTALYTGTVYNARLDSYEFMMPTLYAMAKNVCQAQQAALREGNTIVLYEAFRPYEIQRAVSQELHLLTQRDAEVRAGVYSAPWSIDWFINTNTSNHQMGYAMDISLAKITKSEVAEIAGHQVVQALEYSFYTMPTPIHELSRAAATYTRPFSPTNKTLWKTATMTPTFAACEPALAMQRYCTAYGLTPLASEWWHFNDLRALDTAGGNLSGGKFYIEECCSMTAAEAQKILEQVA